jgi:hypothetical protein
MIVAAIVAAEAAFWMFLVGGLASRYVLRRPRLGMALLLGSPVADVVLLTLTAVDVSSGSAPTQAHALAAMYIGFSAAFGHDVVRWADRRFARRFAEAATAAAPRRTAREHVSDEWRQFRKAALAWAISSSLLVALTLLVGDLDRAQPLLGSVAMLTGVLVVWLVTGPVPASVALIRSDFIRSNSTNEVNP